MLSQRLLRILRYALLPFVVGVMGTVIVLGTWGRDVGYFMKYCSPDNSGKYASYVDKRGGYGACGDYGHY